MKIINIGDIVLIKADGIFNGVKGKVLNINSYFQENTFVEEYEIALYINENEIDEVDSQMFFGDEVEKYEVKKMKNIPSYEDIMDDDGDNFTWIETINGEMFDVTIIYRRNSDNTYWMVEEEEDNDPQQVNPVNIVTTNWELV